MANFEAWKIIGYIEIFYFFIAGLVAAHLAYRFIRSPYKLNSLVYSLSLVVVLKVTAGILSVILLSKPGVGIGVGIAFIIMNNMCAGIFLRILMKILDFVNLIHSDIYEDDDDDDTKKFALENDDDEKAQLATGVQRRGTKLPIIGLFILLVHGIIALSKKIKQRRTSTQKLTEVGFESPLLESITQRLIMLSIALLAVGGGLLAGGDDALITPGKILNKIGSIFYLISIIAVLVVLSQKWYLYNHNSRIHKIGSLLILLLASVPFLLVRFAYTACAAFEFTVYYGPKASKFTLFYGDWGIYLGMSFIEECIVMLFILIAGEIMIHRAT